MSDFNRRNFVRALGQSGLAVAAHQLVAPRATSAAARWQETPKFCAFTESFQGWSIPEVCRRFREIGLDGLDLTVRPGGHIEPAEAPRLLPAAAQSAKDQGVKIMMLSTAIVDADREADSLLAAAAEQGIERVKLGYYYYRKFGSLLRQIDESRRRLAAVTQLARKHGVLPCVHVHSGTVIPGSGLAAYLLLREFSTDELGAYVDPMHMTIEGGLDGWRQGLDLLAPWIALASLKNFRWIAADRDQHGQQRWTIRKCPLADGQARIPEFVATLAQIGYDGFFALHSEYTDGGSWRQLSTEECLQQTQRDLQYARQLCSS